MTDVYGIKGSEKQTNVHGLKLAQFLIINDTFVPMQALQLDNFICRRHPTKANAFLLTAMESVNAPCFPGFVCMPYLNPKKGEVPCTYFRLLEEKEIEITSMPISSDLHTFTARTSKSDYVAKVLQLKEQIQLGNIYEINYCLAFFEENTGMDVFDVFLKLIQLTKAPYTFLVKLGDDFIICCSPELFLKKSGTTLYTKPIKGTIKRGESLAEDEHLKQQLQTSLKERTENVMAVDVARNDLSKIAQKGSVSVNHLFNIETFETVHQMVSTVKCTLQGGLSLHDIFQATFPMASMTGAPKTSAMIFIDAFEDFTRSYYSGSFGLIDEQGDFELPVIIRSIFYNQKSRRLSIAAGGAITYLSNPEQEYDEIILKIQAQLKALNGYIQF
ncbi:MAG: anthranilate synthase component I family protein [Bacteroidota bacterium]